MCSLLYVLPVWGRTILPMLEIGKPSENTAVEILTVFMNAASSCWSPSSPAPSRALSRDPAAHGGSAQAPRISKRSGT